jgi:hypothetical protein
VNQKRIIYVLLALLALGGAGYGVLYWRSRPPKPTSDRQPPEHPNVPIAVFGSQQTLDAFLAASDISAQRLHYRRASGQSVLRLDSYDQDAPVAVTAEQANTIRQLFADESTYGWRFAKLCAPNYGVLLTARSNQSTVRIALCFECYIFGVYDSADDTAERVNRENDFVSRSVATLAKQLFPNDPEIQSLE